MRADRPVQRPAWASGDCRDTPGNLPHAIDLRLRIEGKLHDQAGIETARATATRRTFDVGLRRAGYDLRHIREALGLATLSAAKALCDGDPVDLGRIVAKVI